MKKIYEIRECLVTFYSRYESFIVFVLKFLVALITLTKMNQKLGYMGSLSDPIIYLTVSVLCGVLPWSVITVVASVWVLLHLYALSVIAFLAGAVLLGLMFLLYYRFMPDSAIFFVLTPITYYYNIPYVIPVTTGLLQKPYTVISTLCGSVFYFFLQGIKANEALLGKTRMKESISDKVHVLWNQLFSNREMDLMCLTFVLVTLVVYFLRRMSINHAWTIAIGIGVALEFITLMAGQLMLGVEGDLLQLLLGLLLTVLLGWIIKFFCFNLDYSRTERVQFEDDEYYYYVKAVPKISFPKLEKKKKTIHAKQKKEQKRENSKLREETAQEDLMEDWDMFQEEDGDK